VGISKPVINGNERLVRPMKPQFTAALEFISIGVVIWCLCLPLIWRKVPMNRFYGVRIRESFVSEKRWYDINAYGGRLLARWSLLIVVTGLAGFFVPLSLFTVYCRIAGAVVLISLFVPLILIFRWAKATRET
jgi:hypothetical protein